MNEQKFFTCEEIADDLNICTDTVRRGMRAHGFNGDLKHIAPHKTVLTFTYFQYKTFKDAWETTKVIEKNYYTASQVADMAGCTSSWVSAIANQFQIERIVRPNHISKVAYYPKESAEKIVEIVNLKKSNAYNTKKAKAVAENPTPDEDENLHPLVTDKRFLKLNYFPETVPSCFEE